MTYDDIQAWVGLFSVITAFAAILLSVRTERRNRQVSTANARPLLSISGVGYNNRRGLRLTNNGVGTAIVTKVAIKNGDRTGNSVADVVDVDVGENVVWDTFRRFKPPLQPVAAGEERKLIELTQAGLTSPKNQGRVLSDEQATQILQRLKHALATVEITIEYKDIFDNVQPPCTWNADEEQDDVRA